MTPEKIGESGYTLEEIAAYHDRGRRPAIAEIDGDPQCRAILDSMDHLGSLSRELLEHDAAVELEESWFEQIIGAVALESRAGRDLPIAEEAGLRLVVTEGAVRGLVRDAGDSVEGVLVERVDVDVPADAGGAGSDDAAAVTDSGARIEVALSISVLYGVALPAVADRVRAAVQEAIGRSTPWTVGAIDVTIDSLRTGEDER